MVLSAAHGPARPLRIGVLGAARITPLALLRPARTQPELATVAAIAARDRSRAQRMATAYAIPRVHSTYADLIHDPEIDAIYNPLPNSLHAAWTLAALDAGKHVLCEKPLAANAAEAALLAAAAAGNDRVLMEAFHYRYHPLTLRLLEIVRSGQIGAIRRIETAMCTMLLRLGDIRYRHELAGGALMDTGCYTVHLLRTLAGAEPEVVAARATLHRPQVDRVMHAEFRFPTGATGHIHCALLSRALIKASVRVIGEHGEAFALNPWLPHYFNFLTLRTADGVTRARIRGASTYAYQLRVFVDAVTTRQPFPTNPDDAVANMRVIDAVYTAAGLTPRGL